MGEWANNFTHLNKFGDGGPHPNVDRLNEGGMGATN